MTDLLMFSIRDSGAEFFIQPFFAPTAAVAARMFITSLGDSFPHRAHFDLFQIGSWSSETGQAVGDTPKLVLAGLSIDNKLDPRMPGADAALNVNKG